MSATSPRLRRLHSDLRAMQQLQAESSILHFTADGDLPEAYQIRFLGRGLMRGENSGPIELQERHEVTIRLGAGYPRMMPEIRWKSPIFHPNISGNGSVCLGGYGTYWVPSLTLDELCHMLWDMIRYENYDVTSPYNREAALWAKTQSSHKLPLDARPLRDRLARAAEMESMGIKPTPAKLDRPVRTPVAAVPVPVRAAIPPVIRPPVRPAATIARRANEAEESGVMFLDDAIEAEIVRPAASDSDIMFIQ
ncbi:Ubiquitin-conjugating enzyme [Anatilimnocola aggregata]|uniref:Ubiquitin-conjugating enzyme n=1 Tax=Anatilimnocola aggregata TaxID=2528021 RepID=A0A517Y5H5_9BACT|nr:ubiquitin-conjugating enzyme E2 [Anatilimnocola aggregata]QDU25494.1 Ubiquitin-conjugating enzyme [Anatilimnocola aggregata]